MIGRIVITSVPQGIDGGTGLQPVLRTRGLSRVIAERLAMRSSYPHPYDFGDPRNPRVLFHRIETVGDRAIHVLGSVRDAGSSYTGRSNHLAEIIAIDPAETRGLPGGPVVAAQCFPWLERWSGDPYEVPLDDEPSLPANDPRDPAAVGRSERCHAWAAATGDPGWAGELARSFLEGRRAVIWVTKAVDAAALFAEAARLLPNSVRWQLEFNTCEIEPFPAHWRALRQDLRIVGLRPSNELVLDLERIKNSGQRSPDHDLAKRARGEPGAPPTGADPRGPALSDRDPVAIDDTWPLPRDQATQVAPGRGDDAVLRARLKQISDSRRRRSGGYVCAPVDDGAQTPFGSRWITGLLVASFVGTGAMLLAGIYVARNPAFLDTLGFPVGTGVRSEIQTELRSAPEENEVAQKKKQDEKAAAADKKTREQEENRKAAEARRQWAREAEERRGQEMRAREEADQKRREEEKTKVAARKSGIVAFQGIPDRQVIPLLQTVPDKVLCPFDAEHLIDPACDLAVVGSETIRLQVDRLPDAEGQSPTWTVTGRRFDPIAQAFAGSVVVCRLVNRKGALSIDWPNPEISPQHDLFRAMENSVLIVSCREATGAPEIRRQILFARPIDLVAEGNNVIRLDPLAGEQVTPLDPRVNARLACIDPAELQWCFTLTHPHWKTAQHLRTPDTQITLTLPATPTPGLAIGYQHLDPKGQSLTPLAGDLRVEASLAFAPREAGSHKASVTFRPMISGLDHVPLLRPVITLDSLRDAFRTPRSLDQIENATSAKLEDRAKNDARYRVLAFDAFLRGSADAQKLAITDSAAFSDRHVKLQLQRAAIKVPGRNYPKAGGGIDIYNDAAEYEANVAMSNKSIAELEKLGNDFLTSQHMLAGHEAKAISTMLEDNRGLFDPITVTIQSLSAPAKDSTGTPYPVQIIEPLAP